MQAASGQPHNTLGKYRLIAELGHGGMAEVFLAVARGPAGFNKLCVIKQIRPQLAEDPDFLGMFLDEARLAARLSHPNVVQTNEVGQDGARYFIAMEYLDGQPLNRILHRLGRDGVFGLAMQVRVLIEVLAGLHHAHELTDYDGTPLGVVHRDATPHNVFLTYDGQVKVVDFGIAKAMNSSAETRTGVLKGKVAYMAPEQARGDRVDRRADVFSVGVMLWEAIAGRRLWKGMSDVAVLNHLLSGDIPAPRSVNPNVPPALEAICVKALAMAREDRYATALELQSDLEAALDQMGERVSTREAGKLIAKNFEEDRARIKGVIESQLRSAKNLATGEYQAMDIPLLNELSRSGSMPRSESRPETRSDSGHSLQHISLTPSSSGPHSGPRSAPAPSDPSQTSSLGASMAMPGAPTRSSRPALVAGIVVAAGAALAAILWFSARAGAAKDTPAAPTSDATAAAATAAATPATTAEPARGQVSLRVTASPSDAKIFLDDKPLANNPYSGKLPQDGKAHEIRAEAAGYVTRTRSVTLDKDIDIELALEKTEKATGASPPRRGGSPPPPPPDDPMKPGPKVKRTLDPSNPYAQ